MTVARENLERGPMPAGEGRPSSPLARMARGEVHRPRRDAEELERFKTEINLIEYAAERGFVINPRKTSPNSVFMYRGAEKIIVTRGQDRHWIYANPENVVAGAGGRTGRHGGDQGTIIEFVQREKGGSLGDVRKELRRYGGSDRPKAIPETTPPPPSPRRLGDRAAVGEQLATESREVLNSRYLNTRGIRPETLSDARFVGSFREGDRGDVRFIHRDEEGVSGYEWKNSGFTGFAPGGIKAVWHSRARTTDRTLVIAETAIDALSYHQLHPDDRTRYISTAGTVSAHQLELLGKAMAKMQPGSTVVLATDRDEAGDKMAALLRKVANDKAPHLAVERPLPPFGKDWNDVLKAKEHDYIQRLVSQRRSLGPEVSR